MAIPSYLSAGTNPSPVNQQQGTGFVNLSQFLQANQGNQLGNTLAGDINNQTQQTQNNLNNQNQTFQQGLSQNTYGAPQEQQATNILNNASTLNSGQTIQPGDLSTYQSYASGNYNGPTGLSNSQQLQNQATQDQQIGQGLSNPQGRLGLLQTFIGGNGYNQGQANLDNILLGQNTQALQQAQRQTQNIGQNVNQDVNVAQQQAQNAVAQNQAFGQNVSNQANQAYSNYGNQLQNQVQSDQAQAANQLAQAQSNPYGYIGQTQQSAYGLDPSDIINNLNFVPSSSITASTVGNSNDLARLNALAQLSGTQQNIIQNPSQIGTYTGQYNNPNTTAINQAIQSRENTYNTAANPLQTQIAQLQYALNNAPNVSGAQLTVNGIPITAWEPQLSADQAALKQLQQQYGQPVNNAIGSGGPTDTGSTFNER